MRPAEYASALTLAGCLLGLWAAPAPAGSARVLGVVDGDTVVLEQAGRRQSVDLAGVDAPELSQPHGPQARRALGSRLLGRTVQVAAGADGVRLTVAGEDVAALLVREGHAWVLPGPRQAELGPLEAAARQDLAGLWQGSAAIAPWEWRAGVRTRPAPAHQPAGLLAGDRRSHRFYPAGCAAAPSGGQQVLFGSVAEARAAGFRRAPECAGDR